MRYLLAIIGGLYAQSLMEAEQALTRENYDRVVSITQQVLAAKPKELYAYYLQGQAYIGKYRSADEEDARRDFYLGQAKEVFNLALSKNPKQPYSYIGLAEIDVIEKKPDNAKNNLAKAEEYGANEAKALIETARVYTLVGGKLGTDKATLLLSKAKTKDPSNPAILVGLGDLWLQQGVAELAIDNYQKAITAEPNNPMNHHKLGLAYVKAKSYREAADAFRKATEVDASFAPAYRELGEIYYLVQKYQQAKENYQKYVMLYPELSARVRYATFLYLSKDYKAAVEEIRKAMKDTFSMVLQRLLGYSLIEDGKHDEGLKELAKYFEKQNPERVIAKDYAYYAKALDKVGQDSLAVIYYRKALEKDASLGGELYPEMANALNSLGRFVESAQALEKVIELNPSNLNNYYKLGVMYYRIGQSQKDTNYFHKAIQTFTYIKEKKPDLVPVYTELGRCAAMLDPESTQGRAKPHYEKVVELGSADPTKYRNDLIEAYSYLGYYHYNKEEFQQSYNAYTKLKELDPQNPQAAQAIPYLESVLKQKQK
ncbi:MAG: tetratricopeptide repeat protein [Bacteroidia bacterium]|nr:tetratricopeptide repeat protein [Bacteroidia bacterium]MDW8236335.1 tetratricopeptide repeat protein [Bacteroidia bacterium]